MKPPYEITPNILSLYGQISESLGICKSILIAKPQARLRKENRIKTIHGSLRIEGNTLSIKHITAILEGKPVIGPKNDILEVENAIKAYNSLNQFNPFSLKDFLKAHGLFMDGLIPNPGNFRKTQVGIVKGKEVYHVAPGYKMVTPLMQDLFDYIKNDSDLEVIKTCVFHYETEFIHPFEDGNGRMGRYWQTRLLMNINPVFEYVPIEDAIRNNQSEYYKSLKISDSSGSSTCFLEFMLDAINTALKETIQKSKAQNINYSTRTEYALSQLSGAKFVNDVSSEYGWFDRKEYMQINKGVSTATASRDLKQMVNDGIIESKGSGRMTKYRFAT
ncbi:hypothetical protein AGMMS50212_12660 [Spirochaetia bacterium]|nr:hypothetical protein AGMMS50212_12660 [Spirochaetia bacterium]